MGLCLNFLSVLKGEADIVGAVDGSIFHHAVPAFKGEFHQRIRHLFKGIQEGFHVGTGRLLLLNLGSDFFQPGFGPVEALHQAVVAFLVFCLVQRQSPSNLWLHCQMVLRYLLLECHTFDPYQLPHSPHLIFVEKG